MSEHHPFGVGLVTLFPEFFAGPLSLSIPGRAEAAGAARWAYFNPRDYATNRHKTVDDTPYGGGAGMVMRPTELAAAVEAARAAMPGAPVVLMTPQGRPVSQPLVGQLARGAGVILVCGRYEGVDERFVERHVDLEVCVGEAVPHSVCSMPLFASYRACSATPLRSIRRASGAIVSNTRSSRDRCPTMASRSLRF
jgi:tRNA (guanine37-N1)-methyltransferase